MAANNIVVPGEILQTLTCINCSNYLSVFPIFTKNDSSGAICGRCKVSNSETFIRDEAYEALAQFLIFPCRDTPNGCSENLTPSVLAEHERVCAYRKFECPSKSYSKCEWKGSRIELLEHFEEKHKKLLLRKPMFELQLVNSLEDNLLLSHDNEIFVVRREIDTRRGFFYCYVEMLYSEKEINSNQYFLKLENINKNYFHKCPEKSTCENENQNGTQISLEFLKEKLQEPAAIIVNIEVFHSNEAEVVLELEEKAEVKKNSDINWDLLNELECPICYDYMLPPIFQCVSGHSICEFCVKKVDSNKCPICTKNIGQTKNFILEGITQHLSYPCKYHKAGCCFVSKSTDIRTHETTCEYGPNKCPMQFSLECNWTGNYGDIGLHVENNHRGAILTTDKIDTPFHKQKIYKEFLSKFEGRFFKIIFKYEEEEFFWAVQLVGPGHDAKLYRYEIDIQDLSGSKRRCYFVGPVAPVCSEETFENRKTSIFATWEQLQQFITNIVSFRCRIVKD